MIKLSISALFASFAILATSATAFGQDLTCAMHESSGLPLPPYCKVKQTAPQAPSTMAEAPKAPKKSTPAAAPKKNEPKAQEVVLTEKVVTRKRNGVASATSLTPNKSAQRVSSNLETDLRKGVEQTTRSN